MDDQNNKTDQNTDQMTDVTPQTPEPEVTDAAQTPTDSPEVITGPEEVTTPQEEVSTPEETIEDTNDAIDEPKIEEASEENEKPASEETGEPKMDKLNYDELPTEQPAPIEEIKPETIKAESTTDGETTESEEAETSENAASQGRDTTNDDPNAKWYVVHTYSGHENKVASAVKQRVESEHLEHKILDVLVPTQDKIEIKAGKKEQVKEKIFPGYILVKMVLDDSSWLAVRTTQGVTSFVGIGNKPTPIPEHEVRTIVKFMNQGAQSTFKDVYMINDTIKIIDGPFADFIGKVDSVDKERGKVRVLVSIFGRETPVELDFLQVQKL